MNVRMLAVKSEPTVRYDADDDPNYVYISAEGGGLWMGVAYVPALIEQLTATQARMNTGSES
jgi:hypothetical protein